ncbi:hypothetical protein MBLNU457_1957t2 [Dothideomycetes sp. NU457]
MVFGMSKEEETSRRKKERDTESPRSRDKERVKTPKKSSKRRSTSREADRTKDNDATRLARSSMSDLAGRAKKVTMSVPEMERRSSLGESKASSYPAFSKAHSRESTAKEDNPKPKVSILTPDVTDIGKDDHGRSTRPRTPKDHSPTRAPPSPPLTSDEGDLRRAGSANSSRRSGESAHRSSWFESAKDGKKRRLGLVKGGRFKADFLEEVFRITSEASRHSTLSDSQATSVAPERKKTTLADERTADGIPTTLRPQSAPRTPTSHEPQTAYAQPMKEPISDEPHSRQPFAPVDTPGSMAPPPPPPPPPVAFSAEPPKVDYLLVNGGLPHLIPKSLIPSSVEATPHAYQQYASPLPSNQATSQNAAAQIFAPINKRLEDLGKVIDKSGSIAVATGYRSVARRLLDRLEHVFARNISSEKCMCVVCSTLPRVQLSEEEENGLSWGEILEFVSGRKELPQWPPFSLDTVATGLGIDTNRVATPMQRLDPDVPAEFREHYLKQNDKTKRSVQSWLESQQPDYQTAPPVDVDNETLSFAMLTRLDPEKRLLFTALMRGQSSVATSRAPTPVPSEDKNDVLAKTALALQRLYRLRSTPRDPECTIYLLNNPHLHSVLATIAAISPAEWDILTSGRFDGFLWSGAENPASTYTASGISRGPPRGPTPMSRGTTPFSPLRNLSSPAPNGTYPPSRGPTPSPSVGTGGIGAPVQHDEETEIAVLAEVEREIFLGMERLEDQFEMLHQQAEKIRQRLRERAAGLAMAAQARRGGDLSDPDMVRIGTPWSVDGEPEGVGFDDGRSELAPDDSASNISYARRRRHKTRERRTPAVVDEEDEGDDASRRRRR